MRLKAFTRLFIVNTVLALFAGFLVFGVQAATGPSSTASACGGNTANQLFGIIKEWHHYLPCDGGQVSNDIELEQLWLIALALFEGALSLGAIASFAFIVWGGFKYITSQGGEGAASARKTIINAIAGLIITVSSAVVTRFVVNLLSEGNLANGNPFGIPGQGANSDAAFVRVIEFVYAIAAIVAVIYVIVNAIRFSTSAGDSGKVRSARNGIIYSIIGMLVVLSAAAITTEVVERLDASSERGTFSNYA